MEERQVGLSELLSAVGRRWRRLVRLQAWALGAGLAAIILLAGVAALLIADPEGPALIAAVGLTSVLALAVVLRSLWGVRQRPSDRQLARLIEERTGGLDDVLVTAVEYAERPDHSPQMARLLAADAARAAGAVDYDTVIPRERVARARRLAIGAAFASAAAVALFIGPFHRAALLTTAYLFPARLGIEVVPGDARVPAGEPFTITARVSGVDGGLVPALVAGEDDRQAVRMQPSGQNGEFTLTLESLRESFSYRVTAGAVSSRAFIVTVVRPPRVERIDLRYDYPRSLGLSPRVDEDSGDIYAPAGTEVRVSVTADKALRSAALVLDDGTQVPLAGQAAVVDGTLVVGGDGSYRIVLADTDGLENPGEIEYFIRVLTDRPPDVRIMRPAGDRQVTALEEVLIEARADDDYGIASLDLVFQSPGRPDRVVSLEGSGQTVTGQHLLHLEDLAVQPGDFVTYYARARDVGRGRRSIEARSDIFFLEVKPFEETFRAAQSQSMTAAGGGGSTSEDLAAVQREIIVATWKLDSRGRRANDARSAQDIRTIASAQADLKARAEQMAGQMGAAGATGRRGARPQMGLGGDDPMTAAVAAMGRASEALDRLRTDEALPHEMEALNQLLRAQADVRERQVARQQGGGGGGGNRQQADLSSLFDQELRRNQETNYETPASSETRDDRPTDDPLEALRELARRQDALNRQQRDLARNRDQLEAAEARRRLERLTRDQEELRRRAEDLARQLQQQQRQQQARGSQQAGAEREAGTGPEGQQSQGSASGGSDSLRAASDEMRQAAGELGREDPEQAMARGARALEQLQRAEEQLRQTRPDDRRRALGDLQLETQQLADAQRRLASEAAQTGAAGTDADARRRLAGEQDRLADRAERLREAVQQLGAAGRSAGDEQQAMNEAGREIEQQRLTERMREAAQTLRQGEQGRTGSEREPAREMAGVARQGEEVARALDRVAERLGAATGAQDAESRRLSEQLARTRELRERMAEVERALERLEREGQQGQAGDAGGERQGREGQTPGAQGGRADGGGQGGADAGRGDELGRLQRDAERQMRELQDLADRLQQDSPGMAGGTPEGWRPSVSAPGTEAFKQDFSRWESLKAHLLLAIEQVEGDASARLRTLETRDRLNAGRHESAPDAYRELVDRYYRSLAAPRKNPQ